MRKTFTAIGITWLVGIIWKFYLGDYINEPGLFYQIVFLIAGGAGLLVWVLPLPLIIGIVQKFRTKKFPHDTFAKSTYIILVLIGTMIFIGTYFMKNPSF